MIEIDVLETAGLTDQQIVAVIKAYQAKKIAIRRAQNRKSQQKSRSASTRHQISADSADSAVSADTVSPFDEFWQQYPAKKAKGRAKKSFDKAIKTVEFSEMMAALFRYKAKNDYREWLHPATWLNQQCWLDQPAEPVGGKSETGTERRARLAAELHAKTECQNDASRSDEQRGSNAVSVPGQQNRMSRPVRADLSGNALPISQRGLNGSILSDSRSAEGEIIPPDRR